MTSFLCVALISSLLGADVTREGTNAESSEHRSAPRQSIHHTHGQKPLPIESQLGKRMSIAFDDTTLRDVVKHLAKTAKINIVLDQNGLDLLGLDPDVPVSLELSNVPLRQVLELMLEPLVLTYLVRDDVLVITDAHETGGLLETRVYPVVDLVRVEREGETVDVSEELMELLQSTVRWDTWKKEGGLGTIALHEPTQSFVVSQTPIIHRKLDRLLHELRVSRNTEHDHEHRDARLPELKRLGGNATRERAASHRDDERSAKNRLTEMRNATHKDAKEEISLRKKIEQAYLGAVDIEFEETTLSDAMEFLRDSVNINIVLDKEGLEYADTDADALVTLSVQGIPLGDALDLMLEPLGLTHVIRNNVLVITDAETDDMLETRVYPVADLVGEPVPGNNEGSLFMVIVESTVSPDSWRNVPLRMASAGGGLGGGDGLHGPSSTQSNGGKGTIAYHHQTKSLVVRQTRRVHEKVERLFDDLRSARGHGDD
ncbi:hypothetical protein Pan216_33830 [Planctomycetes bacterium Pan216]|uniref:Secretin/TonB short N-terminal domain-containing protein n=1 Tax=Kolteria novifilia TaxID=2527975 RepID=A0A518B6C8_9BACT|nr:hypothetical protein Pan216_33830 [Planctomycetes bacterium Pan216]